MNKAEMSVRCMAAVALTALGLSGSAETKPQGWYYWFTQGFGNTGCAEVFVMQSHEAGPDDYVTIDIQPNGGSTVSVDISGNPVSIFEQTVCAPGATTISVNARREK